MKTLVLMPTYNEIETLKGSIDSLLAFNPTVDVLIIDDNSPDGTGALADKLALSDARIQILHRSAKQGLGRAYIDGFITGIAAGYTHLVQMDADGSHRPEDLPALLAVTQDFDLVIGSRWIAGGAVKNWPIYRQLISRLGNRYAAWMLGSELGDLTAGFRIYSAHLLSKIDLSKVQAQGYGFQVEMTSKARGVGASITEVPITFVERVNGRSKMNLAIVFEAYLLCTKWGILRLFKR